MHTRMIKDATHEQLKSFLLDQFDELKNSMPELYEEMECELYEHIYGPHFTDWKYDCAVSKLENADGSKGAHWKVSDVADYARSKGLSYKGFNEYDLAYVMNIMFSDYYGAVPDSTDSFFKLAVAFLEDKDAPEGKAWKYWKAMK